MSLILIETQSPPPLTPEFLKEADSRAYPCLTERNAIWRYSLLSSDRHRMICTFDAPDVESVREAYRKAQVGFARMWAAEMVLPEGGAPGWNEPLLKVVEFAFAEPPGEDAWTETQQRLLAGYAKYKVEWIRSYPSRDQTRILSELHAADVESIQEAHRQSEVPCDRLWSAQLLLPRTS